MGEVWRAEQTRPIRRTVALKLIKVGMDTEHVIARFEAERRQGLRRRQDRKRPSRRSSTSAWPAR